LKSNPRAALPGDYDFKARIYNNKYFGKII
jgi:hypothetical protein